ncbi:hypothetical protein GX645_04950 [Candidatus Sumerlaeota bacterium]|nr:hypothetical protein [Candidatus Sumerlaeota bacterium]
MKEYLIGIVSAPEDESALNQEQLQTVARDSGFECSIKVVDPIKDIAAFRDWVEDCHKAHGFAFIALDDQTGTLGVLLYGFTHLPVIRIPREKVAAINHLPAIGTIEQAILHLSRFVHETDSYSDEQPRVSPNHNDLFFEESEPVDEAALEAEDKEELELIDKAFKDKSWLSGENHSLSPKMEEPPTPKVRKHTILDYTPALRSAIMLSRHLAIRDNTDEISPSQLLEAFIATDNSACGEALRQLCEEPRLIYEFVANVPRINLRKPVALIPLAEQTMYCIEQAKKYARQKERIYIDTFDVMRAMLLMSTQHNDLLRGWGIEPQTLLDDRLPFDLIDEYAVVREEEERHERIRPRKPLSTRELSALMQQVPQHLLPRSQPMPEPRKEKAAAPKEIKLEKSAIKEPAVLTPNSIRRFSQDNPPLDLVEQVCDTLLGGSIIGMPTDTTYVLAADATNARAVERLLSLRAQTDETPLVVLFDTPTALQNMITGYSPEVRKLTNIGWPGGLVLKLRRKGNALRHAGIDGNLYLRQPASYPVLAIISMMGRPLAVIDSGCDNANKVRKEFASKLAMILDTGMDGTGPELIVDGTDDAPVILHRGEYVASEVLNFFDKINGK